MLIESEHTNVLCSGASCIIYKVSERGAPTGSQLFRPLQVLAGFFVQMLARRSAPLSNLVEQYIVFLASSLNPSQLFFFFVIQSLKHNEAQERAHPSTSCTV